METFLIYSLHRSITEDEVRENQVMKSLKCYKNLKSFYTLFFFFFFKEDELLKNVQ